MELELNRAHLTGYETVLDTTVFQEETLETIVPDACPDILRLVDTKGKLLLKSKTATDGRVTLTGAARLTVLYQPDGGTGLNHLEVNIPVQIIAEESGIRADCPVCAVPRIVSVDTRTMNPRKILTRVEIAVTVKVYKSVSFAFCAGIQTNEGTVEQLTETCRFSCVSAVQEKQISFEDILNIPAGRLIANELTGSRVELMCRDSKVIGNKLILKGDCVAQIFYRTASGELDAVDFTLPFSQIMEVTGVGEEARAEIELCLTGADFSLGEDGRSVTAVISMLAQAIVREERNVTLLVDAYSICGTVKTEAVPFVYRIRRAEGVGRQAVRETVESGIPVKSVMDAYCMIGRTERRIAEHGLRFDVQVTAVVVCLSEEGGYFSLARSLDIGCPIEAPEECDCQVFCRIEGMSASPTADGVEIRFQLEAPHLCLETMQRDVVCDAIFVMEEDDKRQEPSVVLRVLGEGDRLWDVAKCYRTTIGDIVKANELECEQPAPGTLLLIPRKR